MLHNASLRVEFNPLKIKEIDEAKKKYIDARNEGRRILSLTGVPIESFGQCDGGFVIAETEIRDGHVACRIFDETGDRRLVWNFNDPAEIKEARTLFDQYIAKGWKPYAVDRAGNIGRRITRFDWDSQEIHFDDRGTKERLKEFSSKFKEVKLLPRTYPG